MSTKAFIMLPLMLVVSLVAWVIIAAIGWWFLGILPGGDWQGRFLGFLDAAAALAGSLIDSVTSFVKEAAAR